MQAIPRAGPDEGMGKWLGIVAFALGVALLVLAFVIAYGELRGGSIATLATAGVAETNFNAVFAALLKGLFLFVMGYLASAIAGRGIGLYQASRGVEETG